MSARTDMPDDLRCHHTDRPPTIALDRVVRPRHGAEVPLEGRNPSARFDTAYYVVTNDDVLAFDLHPLVHYLRFGSRESRPPTPVGREVPPDDDRDRSSNVVLSDCEGE